MTKIVQKWYPLKQAIKKLDINEHTLCTWVLADAIEIVSKPDPKTGRHYLYVSDYEIKHAFDAKCCICSKTFQAKYPLNAMYCSQSCRNKGIYANFKKRQKPSNRK